MSDPAFRYGMRAILTSPLVAVEAVRAWLTLEPADWSAVADRLESVARLLPEWPAPARLHVQALRSARRLDEAVTAGQQALRKWPHDARIRLQLGRAQRHAGLRSAAIDTLAAAAEEGSQAAIRELCRYSARARLPAREAGIFARADYASFARMNPVPAPPQIDPAALFRICPADPVGMSPASLDALLAQSYAHWSLAPVHDSDLKVFDLNLPVGAILDPHCLAWMNWAVAETGCAKVYADHDHRAENGADRCDPVFLPMPDGLWMRGAENPVRLLATDGKMGGLTSHIPLVLMTLPFETGRRQQQYVPDGEPRPISVVIPTKDNPVLLEEAVKTLIERAGRPDLVEIVIIDNGSRTEAARQMFASLSKREGTRVLPFDVPFNWPRINNFAAAEASGESLMFLNDDTAMLTKGWDRILAGLLDDPAVGVIGSRMIYPDGSIQHGGFVFGMDNGPQHEGRWMSGEDRGPGARWDSVRQAVAVTGAFMVARKEDFVRLNGFDAESFSVDFADIDLCLRFREAGLAVAYCGPLTFKHHESVSRGLNLSRAKKIRMRSEREAFERRWKQWSRSDPGYHPVWARTGASFDGLCALSIEKIQQHIGRATERDIWSIIW